MTTAERVIRYQPEGSLVSLFNVTDPEILVEGPAGTGKTYAICHLLHLLCLKYPGMRALIARKTLTALTGTALVTFQEKVLTPGDPVSFYGGSKAEAASFRYENGSRIVVGGMDNPSKILSSEYDLIFINEATELSEEDWETLTTRLRNGVLKFPRIIGDCNPSYDRHWLLQRCLKGQTRRIVSRHADNPTLTDDYLASLQRLSGTRYQRLYAGEWVGMENAIYPQMTSNLLTEIPERTQWTGQGSTGVDFGRVHLSAVCSVTRASDGVLWVREVWAEPGGNLQAIEDACRGHRLRFGVRRGVVDPIQEVLGQRLGYKVAKSGAGSRKGRIEMVTKLLDAGALRFDKHAEGVQELYDEMCMYRYEVHETDTLIEDIVVRKDDDRVAALEYAIEGLEDGVNIEFLAWQKPRAAQPAGSAIPRI